MTVLLKKPQHGLCCLCVALACWTAPALADEPAAACGSIVDDMQRLACYDASFRKTAPAQPDSSRPAAMPAPSINAGAPTASTSASNTPTNGATPSGSSNNVTASPKDFGHEFRRERDTSPKQLTSTVTQVAPLERGLYRLTLDNGQVWQTTEADWALTFHTHSSITISRMMLGNYLISRTGQGRSVAVKRLQ